MRVSRASHVATTLRPHTVMHMAPCRAARGEWGCLPPVACQAACSRTREGAEPRAGRGGAAGRLPGSGGLPSDRGPSCRCPVSHPPRHVAPSCCLRVTSEPAFSRGVSSSAPARVGCFSSDSDSPAPPLVPSMEDRARRRAASASKGVVSEEPVGPLALGMRPGRVEREGGVPPPPPQQKSGYHAHSEWPRTPFLGMFLRGLRVPSVSPPCQGWGQRGQHRGLDAAELVTPASPLRGCRPGGGLPASQVPEKLPAPSQAQARAPRGWRCVRSFPDP